MRYPYIIEELKKKGSVPGLEATQNLLRELNHPEQEISIVHVAGTNGKGSVIAYLSSILQESGYRVGRFVSPTIDCYRERFQINGIYMEEEKLEQYFCRIAEAIEHLKEQGEATPTLFEAETALAFLYFAEEKVDYALVETGMGGLLDATNVIEHPILTVLTSISMDHREALGETLEEIAVQKAGIIKSGTPVILSENVWEIRRLIRHKAEEMQAEYLEVSRRDYEILEERPEGSRFLWENQEYETTLPGSHQISNAVTALTAARVLQQKKGQKITTKSMIEGIAATRWPGRLELLGKNPYFFRDGAHNPDGARKLAAFLEKHFTNKRILFIMGVLKDKEYDKMLSCLMPLAESVYVFRPDNDRGLDATVLADAVRHYGIPAHICSNVQEAVHAAFCEAGSEDVLVACGSLSFMEEMKDCDRTEK